MNKRTSARSRTVKVLLLLLALTIFVAGCVGIAVNGMPPLYEPPGI